MSEQVPTKEKLPTTAREWTKAWRDFNSACKKLGRLAEREGDLLKIDVKYKPSAGRKG